MLKAKLWGKCTKFQFKPNHQVRLLEIKIAMHWLCFRTCLSHAIQRRCWIEEHQHVEWNLKIQCWQTAHLAVENPPPPLYYMKMLAQNMTAHELITIDVLLFLTGWVFWLLSLFLWISQRPWRVKYFVYLYSVK